MKSWELFKHLEEGKCITFKGGASNSTHFKINNLPFGIITDILCKPNDFEIIKPKEKIKLYRHLSKIYYQGDYTENQYGLSNWTSLTAKKYVDICCIKGTKILKTEEKEIEIDYEKTTK